MFLLSVGGANIDFQHSDGWALMHLGIFSRWESNSGRTRPNDPNTSNSYGDGGKWTYTIWGNNLMFGGDDKPTPFESPFGRTPCKTMAIRAGDLARKYMEKWQTTPPTPTTPGGKNWGNEAAHRSALREFDNEFASAYTGAPADGLYNTYRLWKNSGNVGRTAPMSDLGQDDFRTKFIDDVSIDNNGGNIFSARRQVPTPNDMNPDQVHHFSTYLSMGINGNLLAYDWHRADDLEDGNVRDVALGDAGWKVGLELKFNPDKIWDLERWIRDNICQ
jgi:hypothetical protein